MKLTTLLVIAVAFTIAGTGCRKRPTGVTPINARDQVVRDRAGMDDLAPIPNTNDQLPDGTSVAPLSSKYDDLSQFNQDRSALAANIVHFDYDSSVVKSSEQAHVEAVASYMKANTSAGLLIEGHCDERGTEDYNNSLGERRATALRETLINLGVSAENVVTRTFGEYKPVAQGQDESAYAQNRRGEFIVLTPK